MGLDGLFSRRDHRKGRQFCHLYRRYLRHDLRGWIRGHQSPQASLFATLQAPRTMSMDKAELLALARPWRDKHMVTPCGEVFSRKAGEWHHLKPQIDKGYRKISVKVDGVFKPVKCARIVCEVYHGPKPFEKAVVRHLNDIKGDDRAENLAWGSVRDNALDAVRNGTSPAAENGRKCVAKRSGDLSVHARLSWEKVREIRHLRSVGVSVVDLSERFSVDEKTISSVCLGRSWIEVGMIVTAGHRGARRPYGTGRRATGARNLKAGSAGEVA